MRKALGVAVFSGMLGVTLFGIFLTPVFFYVIEGIVEAPIFTTARSQHGQAACSALLLSVCVNAGRPVDVWDGSASGGRAVVGSSPR